VRDGWESDMTLFLFVLVLTVGVQLWLRSVYGRWGQVSNASGLTGAETAAAILRANGLFDLSLVAGRR
jgi:Zn-dependent membrane protease YugP